ncbi:MAG: hypothetical protein CMJ89_09500 [Planctomycetes bacterium]|jgi:hypothetical protein|nr:hypothetical protein [Planctomycetota bacterium]
MRPTTNSTYDVRGANRLLPLLNSIGREIQERTEALDQLEDQIGCLSSSNRTTERTGALLAQASAEAATQRRAIRQVREELQRFGCSVLGTDPLTIRIPGRVGEAKKSFVWQTGDPVLK